ncbi:hypothetical protein [Streptosporangium sp. NPDC006930]|uniref:hypothetical protein n=1 Tax=Streptosporangium sp. NPDC006930 TaxID=3154783 RepID=UPI0034221376
MSQIPSVGRIVHYVSHGTPPRPDGTQAFTSQCRAAIVTAVQGQLVNPADGENTDTWIADLAVINPTGLFFHEGCEHHDGAETPGSPDCPNSESHGSPHRYCACGWMEASPRGGTWHWPERV